jgi:uncharacterized repeat protein (TIGR03847 family)
MSNSFDLSPERFTAGALGPKGERVFYLQAVEQARVVSLRLEKQQVGALADYLERLLEDLPASDPASVTVEQLQLAEPVLPEWVIGGLGVAYDERDDRVVLVAEELVPLDDDDDDDDDDEDWLAVDGDTDADTGAVARFRLQRSQVRAFVNHARGLVAAGRPTCRRCGRPLEPTLCPCYN